MRNKKIIVIGVLGFLLYFNSFFNAFVWDDEEQVVNNSAIHSLSNFTSYWTGSTFNSGGGTRLGGLYYKPLMTTTFSFLYTLFGSRSFFFHFFQVTLHIVNSILLFLMMRYLLKNEWTPFISAIVFLIHPINSESVVYVSALQEPLFFFFGALALLLLIKKDGWKAGFLTAGLLLLSLFAKETGVVWVAICGLYVLLFKRTKIGTYILPTLMASAFYAYLRFGVAQIFFNKHGLAEISRVGLVDRLKNIPAVFFYYLKTFLWPSKLAIDQQWHVSSIGFANFFLPLALDLLFIGLLIGGAIMLLREKSRYFSLYVFFVLWFLGAFLFHLHLFPLDMTVSERWFYLPLAGLIGAAGVLMEGLSNMAKLEKNKPFITIICVILGLLFLRTLVRTFDWRDGLTLYSHDIKISRDSFSLENNLGVALFRIGKMDEAKVYFERSVELLPDWTVSNNNLGAYWDNKGDLTKAEEYYFKAVSVGSYHLAYQNYALVLLKQKKYQQALDFLEKIMDARPNNSRLVMYLTIAYYQTGHKEEAKKAAQYLFSLEPTGQNKTFYEMVAKGESLDGIFKQ